MTKTCLLSWQKYACRDKTFIVTKMILVVTELSSRVILVADPTNDILVPSCLYPWRLKQGHHAWQLCHQPAFLCTSLLKSEPTWPCPVTLKLEVKKYCFWSNTDRTTKWSSLMEIFTPVQANMHFCFRFPLTVRWQNAWKSCGQRQQIYWHGINGIVQFMNKHNTWTHWQCLPTDQHSNTPNAAWAASVSYCAWIQGINSNTPHAGSIPYWAWIQGINSNTPDAGSIPYWAWIQGITSNTPQAASLSLYSLLCLNPGNEHGNIPNAAFMSLCHNMCLTPGNKVQAEHQQVKVVSSRTGTSAGYTFGQSVRQTKSKPTQWRCRIQFKSILVRVSYGQYRQHAARIGLDRACQIQLPASDSVPFFQRRPGFYCTKPTQIQSGRPDQVLAKHMVQKQAGVQESAARFLAEWNRPAG